MKIDPNDPRLTAYALGELGNNERAEIGALIKDDEVAQREVETIRRATFRVTEELQSESCPRLNPQQLAAIEERLSTFEKPTLAFPWWQIVGWTTALGAAALVLAALLPRFKQASETPHILTVQTPVIQTRKTAITAQNNQTESLPYILPPGKQAVTINTGGAAIVGQVVRPGDRVDILETLSDPKARTETTRILSQNMLVLAERKGQLTLATDGRNLDSLKDADHAGALQFALRPPSASEGQLANNPSGVSVASGEDTWYSYPRRVQPASPRGTLEVQPFIGGFDVAQEERAGNSGGNVLFRDGHYQWQDRPDDVSKGTQQKWVPGKAPSGAITVYRGREVETLTPTYFNAESYSHSVENAFVTVVQQPLSTFSLDVDTASYANIRRFLNQGQLPPRDAVRIEEMLNYFPYNYPPPRGREPFSLYVEMGECPWNSAHRLALVALKAKDIPARKAQPMNLVFLIDVSGSMADANKLPLIKQSLRMLVEQLTAQDRVAIVVYANDSRVALPSTSGDDKEAILEVIDSLEAGGSTNGGAGIQTAYHEAISNFIEGGVNRVILCTDGDFNVGVTDQGQLIRLIQQQAKSNVFLTILGVGMGNLKDSTMQKLADKGNGNYAYIDSLGEAHKVLAEQMRGTLVTVAKDAKVQIEFNPALVQSYRLIGYEKRRLRAQDFNNDRKDAGEVGAGHAVTALYEIVPAGAPAAPGVDPLKYQPQPVPETAFSGEMMTVKLRYKEPEASSSQLLTASVKDQYTSWRGTSADFRFAASIAAFGLVLRDSPYKGGATCDLVLQLADGTRGYDPNGYRNEFINMVDRARALSGTSVVPDDP
jgi:Ca-activated chloride channel homolog